VTDRPNILLFMTDQQRANSVGMFGNDRARTPHIDALAARGTRFTARSRSTARVRRAGSR
jgi:arylsulfatase A-like enzyme